MVRHDFGERIRKIRRAQKLTQAEIARRASMDDDKVSRIENCRQSPTVADVEAVAKALGVNPAVVLGYQDELSIAEWVHVLEFRKLSKADQTLVTSLVQRLAKK